MKTNFTYTFAALIIFTLLVDLKTSIAQGAPTIFDCLEAQPICDQLYKEDFIPRGTGNFTGEINSNFS